MHHNLQTVPVASHGNSSVGLNKLRQITHVMSPEQLADILEEPHTRRSWWLDLPSTRELFTGTTIGQIEQTVEKTFSGSPFGRRSGSQGEPAKAPFFAPEWLEQL